MFSAETLQKFAREVAKYPADQKQSAVMACLAHAQEEKGWLPPDAIEAVADYLGMPPMAAYEVASFYNMYDLKPVGKYKITVCTNLPCALRDGVKTAEYLKEKLGIGFNRTTSASPMARAQKLKIGVITKVHTPNPESAIISAATAPRIAVPRLTIA